VRCFPYSLHFGHLQIIFPADYMLHVDIKTNFTIEMQM
jgi:hypothetical protein